MIVLPGSAAAVSAEPATTAHGEVRTEIAARPGGRVGEALERTGIRRLNVLTRLRRKIDVLDRVDRLDLVIPHDLAVVAGGQGHDLANAVACTDVLARRRHGHDLGWPR